MHTRPVALARDLLLAVVAVAVALADLAVAGQGKTPHATAWLLLLATAASVGLAHRYPLPVLAFVAALSLALVSLGYRLPSSLVPPAIALYAVARTGTRARTLWTGVAATALAVFAEKHLTGMPVIRLHTLAHVVLIVIPLLLGEAVRIRHGYVDLLLERLELAERAREETARRRVEEERLRIARDLHDVVAHTLTTISVQAGVASHLLDREPQQVRDSLAAIATTSREALDELRGVVGVLRGDEHGAPVEPAPGLGTLERLAADARRQGLEVDLAVDGREPDAAPEAVQLAAFRIVQESLTNVRRHAGRVATEVRVEVGDERLRLSVRNAPGAQARAANGAGAGVGIRGMRERSAALGGSLTAVATPDGGFEVAAELPYRRRP